MALMILSIGLLALAGLGATSLRTARGGAIQTVASSVAGARFDSLASLPCDRIAAAGVTAPVTGTSKARGVEERWSARRLAENNFNMVLVIDTVTVIGRTQRYAFTSRRACR
jgi:type IV pilus assembly protein PilV